jgi:hypothetical protein
MTTLSLGQAARLTGRGKTILTRAMSGRLFAASKEDGGSNTDAAELARVYPFPHLSKQWPSCAPVSAWRRDRDAWREQAQTRLLPAPAAPMSWWRWLRTTG